MTQPQFILPAADNVVAGGTSRFRVPTGDFTYYEIWLHYQESGSDVTVANMKTAIEEIEILLENRTQWKMSATELFAVNEHHNVTAVDGWIPLFLALPDLLTQVPKGADIRDALAWGTDNIADFTIKVKIASGRAAPTLAGYAFGIETAQPLGKILQYLPITLKPDAADVFKRVQAFEEQTERPIVAVYMNSADVYEFEYKIGRDSVFEQIPTGLLDNVYDSRINLKSVSSWGILDFAYTGQPNRDAQPLVVDGVPLINQQFAFKSSSTTAIDSIVELLGERG